jgi:hypothetical protein
MARTKGKPAYPNKSVAGSFCTTPNAHKAMRSASKRTGKSDSDVITHCLLETAPSINSKTPGFEPEKAKEVA